MERSFYTLLDDNLSCICSRYPCRYSILFEQINKGFRFRGLWDQRNHYGLSICRHPPAKSASSGPFGLLLFQSIETCSFWYSRYCVPRQIKEMRRMVKCIHAQHFNDIGDCRYRWNSQWNRDNDTNLDQRVLKIQKQNWGEGQERP